MENRILNDLEAKRDIAWKNYINATMKDIIITYKDLINAYKAADDVAYQFYGGKSKYNKYVNSVWKKYNKEFKRKRR
jgi:hypothetical protein